MRLLFVIHSLKMGGAERVLSIMANHFANSGYEADICVFDGSDIFYEIDKKIKIHDLELGALSGSLIEAVLNNFGRILKLRGKIQAIKPDIVVSFLTHTNIVSILAAKSLRVPVIACEHSNYGFLKSRVWQTVRKAIYPLANVVTILTNADAVNYKKIKRLEVLPNPLTPFEPSGAARQNIVLGVGRLTYSKGFERLIEAFNEADTKDWRLIIVGEGDEKEALLRLIASSPKKEFIAL
ncbi:MAG TPA: glycosyltransferase, partial [Campylobacterales bacterium]|nr:glycosyltransferase [Campylobacterales bacterium]